MFTIRRPPVSTQPYTLFPYTPHFRSRRYYRSHASISRNSDCGFILESATWRASIDWGARLGYGEAEMAEVNRQSIELLTALRRMFESDRAPLVIRGCVGPRSEERRVGQACVSPCRSRWSPLHYKNNK